MRALYIAALLLLAGCNEPVRAEILVPSSIKVPTGNWPDACQPLVPYYLKAKNPSREAALTEQESGCNQFAQSPYAKGYRQFTDSTGKWLAGTHCSHLGSYQPWSREWQMKCGIIYSELKESNNSYSGQHGNTEYCTNRKVGEMEYNGGHWVIWELAYSSGDLVKAREICGIMLLKNGRKRAMWACKENYAYSEHISKRQPKYKDLGGEICH